MAFRGERTWMFRGGRTWMMFSVVFMVVLARSDEPKFSSGLIGAQEADFAGSMPRDGQKQKSAAACAFHFDSKTFVGLLVDQRVRFGGTLNVPIEPVRPLRCFVFDGIEERKIVAGPGDPVHPFETLGAGAPGAPVLACLTLRAQPRRVGRM